LSVIAFDPSAFIVAVLWAFNYIPRSGGVLSFHGFNRG
jgi:hypothetical protein